MRRALRLLLEGQGGIEVIGEAGDVSSAIHHVRRHEPHVLVVDLQAANGSSVEAIRALHAHAPGTGIVVVTMERSPLFAQRVIDAGASGLVLKDLADKELSEAVRRAAHGRRYLSPRVSAALDDQLRARAADGLSVREIEVLRLIALGYTSREIAAALHLSPRTVETHRARIHRKLGLRSRHELVDHALRRGLIGG